MARDAVADFPREIQSLPAVLEHVDDAKALLVVGEASGHERVDHPLTRMTERRMAQVVPKRNRLGELFMQAQDFCDAPRDLRHLERMGQSSAIVIACRRKKALRLVFQPPKGLRVNDAIAVPLKRRSNLIRRLLTR